MADAYNEASDELKPLRLYNGASVYKEEFSDYVDGFKDFCGYYLKKCEEDARRYAENAADEYFERIDEYIDLAEQNPDSALQGEIHELSRIIDDPLPGKPQRKRYND